MFSILPETPSEPMTDFHAEAHASEHVMSERDVRDSVHCFEEEREAMLFVPDRCVVNVSLSNTEPPGASVDALVINAMNAVRATTQGDTVHVVMAVSVEYSNEVHISFARLPAGEAALLREHVEDHMCVRLATHSDDTVHLECKAHDVDYDGLTYPGAVLRKILTKPSECRADQA